MTKVQRCAIVWIAGMVVVGFLLAAPAYAKVEGDTIVFGAAVSFTGKYSTDGQHTKNGYDLAVSRINERGGVSVAGKRYKIRVKY